MQLGEAADRLVAQHDMLPRGSRVLVAVSGGPDSVALLHWLSEAAEEYGSSLHVAHVNHGLRGAESDADEEFVRAVAEGLGLPFAARRVDTAERAAAGESIEMAARALRREALGEMACAFRADRIALGHTADDQLETVILNLLRGTGVRGLAGMSPVTDEGLIRPLLECSREAVLGYLGSRGIEFRTDTSNEDSSHLRNRVRHGLLPLLRSGDALGLERALQRLAENARWEAEALEWAAERALEAAALEESGGGASRCTLSLDRLVELPEGAALVLLRQAYEQVRGHTFGMERSHLREALRLAHSRRIHGRVSLPGGVGFCVTRAGLVVEAVGDEGARGRELSPDDVEPVRLRLPGPTPIPELGVEFDAAWADGPSPAVGDDACAEATLPVGVPTPCWVARSWEPGDRICPKGLGGGSKKIKRLFQEKHVPLERRSRYPVVVDERGELIWVPGLAVRQTKPDSQTRWMRVRMTWRYRP